MNGAAAAATTAQALRDWLIEGPAQLSSGPEAGAVAGTVESSGAVNYVYGEITGYYLHWLASGVVEVVEATRKASSALAWIARRYGGSSLPPTRIHLNDVIDDWRNHAQFCFDLAMLVGGLAKAEARRLIDVPDALWFRLGATLSQFADGTCITALPLGADPTPLPQRWSTSNGPFLAKAASRILLAPARAMVPRRVLQSARRTLDSVGISATEARVEMLHPALYAIEGMICSETTSFEVAAGCLARVLAFDPGDGQLPEARDSAVPRSDVIAQALRLAVWLRAHRIDGAPSDPVIDSLANALMARVRFDGSIAFRPDSEPQINSWCAMFAQQALDWFSRWRATGSLAGISASDLV